MRRVTSRDDVHSRIKAVKQRRMSWSRSPNSSPLSRSPPNISRALVVNPGVGSQDYLLEPPSPASVALDASSIFVGTSTVSQPALTASNNERKAEEVENSEGHGKQDSTSGNAVSELIGLLQHHTRAISPEKGSLVVDKESEPLPDLSEEHEVASAAAQHGGHSDTDIIPRNRVHVTVESVKIHASEGLPACMDDYVNLFFLHRRSWRLMFRSAHTFSSPWKKARASMDESRPPKRLNQVSRVAMRGGFGV